jgi:hypothetical protein
MKENATADRDRDPQARMVWRNHLREKKSKRQTTTGYQHCKPRLPEVVSLEQARARTRMAELELSLQ